MNNYLIVIYFLIISKAEKYILLLAIQTTTIDWEKIFTKVRHLLVILVLNYIKTRRIK